MLDAAWLRKRHTACRLAIVSGVRGSRDEPSGRQAFFAGLRMNQFGTPITSASPTVS